MNRLQFKIDIQAPKKIVYNKMLGLEDKSDYEAWTAAFNPTSTYDGGWNKSDKIRFIGTDENGEKGGMVAEIVENIPNEYVSIRTLCLLKGDEEIYANPEENTWEHGLEIYSFAENHGITTVTVEVDVVDEYVEYFQTTYPKALEILKKHVES